MGENINRYPVRQLAITSCQVNPTTLGRAYSDRDLGDVSDRLACGSDVQHPGLHWWIGDKAPCPTHFFRRVAAFKPRFNAIEQGRRNRDVAECSKTVSDRADVTINTEDFLNDDDSALGRPRWINAISIKLVAVAGSQFEVRSHVWNPFVLRKIGS